MDALLLRIHGDRRAHLARELEPKGVHVGDDDEASAGVARDRRGHDADGTRARDEHVFAEDGERECGVGGVAERIENRGYVFVDRLRVHPHVGHRQGEVLGESSRAIDADALREGAKMAAAGEAVATPPAHDVPLAAHDLAGEKIGDVRTDFHDLADELVTDHHRHGNGLGGPRVPLVDVDVGAADAGLVNPNEDVVDPDFGFGHILEPETRLGPALHQGFHLAPSRRHGVAPVYWKRRTG